MSRMKTVEMLEKFDALMDRVGAKVSRAELGETMGSDHWALDVIYRARQRGDMIETIRGEGRIVTHYMRVSKAANKVSAKTTKAAAKAVVKTQKSEKSSAPVPEFTDNVIVDENDREVKAA